MTSFKLIILRTYTLTLGRFAFFSKLLRKTLVNVLIPKKKSGQNKSTKRYVASSRYFDVDDLS